MSLGVCFMFLLDTTSKLMLFSVSGFKHEKLIKSKPT